jgi:Asp-tRNA(Asn)/Glu-tRNA(Gln) amidotransferase A subunit family amidase
MYDTSLCFLTATELAQKIRAGEISAVETMEAHLAQIEKVNPQVNAIVTLLPEMGMEAARKADEKLARGEEVGPLHGLPVAHKDLVQTKGIRTTFGSLVTRISFLKKTRYLWNVYGKPARFCWAKRIHRNSAQDRRRLIKFLA